MAKQIWKAGNMLYPLPAVLVSTADGKGNTNILTVAWTGTVCTNPAMVYILSLIHISYYDFRERRGWKMPLTMAEIGKVNTIRKVKGNEETKRFLGNLGFIAGAKVTVLSVISGNVIVNIKDSRIAVNADMARHIMI